jgi:hypothetical protein
MTPRILRRRLSGLALAGLVLVPAAAPALPRLDGDRQPAVRHEARGFLAWVGEVVGGFWEATGMMIDPDGEPRTGTTSEVDTGKLIDPNG